MWPIIAYKLNIPRAVAAFPTEAARYYVNESKNLFAAFFYFPPLVVADSHDARTPCWSGH